MVGWAQKPRKRLSPVLPGRGPTTSQGLSKSTKGSCLLVWQLMEVSSLYVTLPGSLRAMKRPLKTDAEWTMPPNQIWPVVGEAAAKGEREEPRSDEHTAELQSP